MVECEWTNIEYMGINFEESRTSGVRLYRQKEILPNRIFTSRDDVFEAIAQVAAQKIKNDKRKKSNGSNKI